MTCVLHCFYEDVCTLEEYLSRSLSQLYPEEPWSQPNDSPKYVKLLSNTYVAANQPHLQCHVTSIQQSCSQRQVIDKVLGLLFRRAGRVGMSTNCLISGFRAGHWHASMGGPMTNPGVGHSLPNTTTRLLTMPVWEQLLSRIGDAVMTHLLLNTALFCLLENECLLQVTGIPITLLECRFRKSTLSRPVGSTNNETCSEPKKRRRLSDCGLRAPETTSNCQRSRNTETGEHLGISVAENVPDDSHCAKAAPDVKAMPRYDSFSGLDEALEVRPKYAVDRPKDSDVGGSFDISAVYLSPNDTLIESGTSTEPDEDTILDPPIRVSVMPCRRGRRPLCSAKALKPNPEAVGAPSAAACVVPSESTTGRKRKRRRTRNRRLRLRSSLGVNAQLPLASESGPRLPRTGLPDASTNANNCSMIAAALSPSVVSRAEASKVPRQEIFYACAFTKRYGLPLHHALNALSPSRRAARELMYMIFWAPRPLAPTLNYNVFRLQVGEHLKTGKSEQHLRNPSVSAPMHPLRSQRLPRHLHPMLGHVFSMLDRQRKCRYALLLDKHCPLPEQYRSWLSQHSSARSGTDAECLGSNGRKRPALPPVSASEAEMRVLADMFTPLSDVSSFIKSVCRSVLPAALWDRPGERTSFVIMSCRRVVHDPVCG
eukprot:Rmarinus@m.28339